MYLDENLMATSERRASYALRTPPVRDEGLNAWHVRLEFPARPGVLALETYATDLNLAQARFVHLRRVFFDNGQLALEHRLDLDGKRLRDGAVYYRSGQLCEKMTPAPNGHDSVTESFHENGQLISRTVYHGEQRADGEYLAYDDRGNLSSRSHLKDGQLHGLWEVFHASGAIFQRVNYVHDRPVGRFEQWDQHGRLVKEEDWPASAWASGGHGG